jgi:DNA-binding NarL/FixJ family response regulator
MSAPHRVRVMIADDHPMFRFGLTAAIGAAPEIDVVGTAASGAELIELVDRDPPDVVVTDLAMPGTDGATATATITARHGQVKVLVLTMHEDDEALFGAMRAGARGYLLKGADSADIVRAVLTVGPWRRRLRHRRRSAARGLPHRRPQELRQGRVPRAHRPGTGNPGAGRRRAAKP